MRIQKNFKESWNARTPLERGLTVVQLVLCAATLTAAILALCNALPTFVMFFPMGCMELTQAYLLRREARNAARICLICGIVILVCSIVILALQLAGV